MHDLLLDVYRSLLIEEPPHGLGLSLAEAHGLVISRYASTLRDGQWHTVARDGYALSHLVWHIVRAERYDELYRLFRESTRKGEHGWNRAWERGGHAGGFQGDLNLASRAAAEHYAATEDPAAIEMQVRSVLISASLNSLAGLIPVEALLEMAHRGVWTLGHALGKAVSYPNPAMPTDALAGVAWIVAPGYVPSVIEAAHGLLTPYGLTEVLLVALQRARGTRMAEDFARVRERLVASPPGMERTAQMLELAAFAHRRLPDEPRETELIRAAAREGRSDPR